MFFNLKITALHICLKASFQPETNPITRHKQHIRPIPHIRNLYLWQPSSNSALLPITDLLSYPNASSMVVTYTTCVNKWKVTITSHNFCSCCLHCLHRCWSGQVSGFIIICVMNGIWLKSSSDFPINTSCCVPLAARQDTECLYGLLTSQRG